MKDRNYKMVSMAVVPLFITAGFAENPLVQTNYTPDPAPMVYNDTVFLYTGHDEDNATGFTMYNYLLYTSTDLVNWRDHGVIASTKSFSWANSNGAWAAQCIPRNGRFYYYCAMNGKGIGVLVSNSPYGPFTDPLGKPLITNSEIDPTVMIDNDGQAYLYFGNPDCRYVKLNQDMISYSGSVVLLPRMQTYQEGPWIYKRDNKYYLSWSSTCCPEGIGYAMSDNANGPWTYKNSIMDGNSNSSGNQPGIFDFKGSTYTTGFTNELWYYYQGGRTTRYERRSASLAKITFDIDGTIPKIPWFGMGNPVPGVPQVGSFNPYDTIQAETICWSKGVRTEVCQDVSGKMNVDSIHNGDLIKVKGVDFKSGAKSFEARVASVASGGSIEIRLDTITGPIVGTCAVAGTSGWQAWETKSCSVSGASGVHDLFLKFTGSGGLLFNFNWWKFTPEPTTGVGDSGANCRQQPGAVTVRVEAGKRGHLLRIDFSPDFAGTTVQIRLFDASGRLLASPPPGNVTGRHMALPLDQAAMPAGVCVLQVVSGNIRGLTKTIVLSR
jgi:arabinoxylan arabinofuranohydrolase